MTQPALFVDQDVLHMVLPNMSLACGRNLLDRDVHISLSSTTTTCPDCLEQPISALCEQMQRRQA